MWKFYTLMVLFCLLWVVGFVSCIALVDYEVRQYYEREIEENNKQIEEIINQLGEVGHENNRI